MRKGGGVLALALLVLPILAATAGLRFASRGDFIQVERPMAKGLNAVSVTMWVKGESKPGNLVVGPAIMNFHDGLGFFLRSAGKSSGYLAWARDVTGNREWQHLAAVWSGPAAGGDGKMRLYVDGVCQETTLAYDGGAEGVLIDGKTALCGCINEAFGGFQGTLEDMRFYKRALTENEVMAIYGMNGSDGVTNGLALWYPLRDGKVELKSGFVQDQSGMGNHGKVFGAPVWEPVDKEAARKLRERVDITREAMLHKRLRGEAQRRALAKWLEGRTEGMEEWNARFAELERKHDELKVNPLGWTFDLTRGYDDLYAQVGLRLLFAERPKLTSGRREID